MELELKHIAPYLPHYLEAIDNNNNIKCVRWSVQTYTKIHVGLNFVLINQSPFFKPLLRPMSDLFKEIEHQGEKVCVASEIVDNFQEWLEFYNNDGKTIRNWDTGEFYDFNQPLVINLLPYCIAEILFQYHFDVFGLIEKGLAEPIKTE